MLCENSNYCVFRNDRQGRGGGVCIFAHKQLTAFETKFRAKFDGIEFICIDVLLDGKKSRFSCAYRAPNSEAKFPGYCNSMCELICDICDVDYPVCIAGDFNFPRILWQADSAEGQLENQFLDCILQNNLCQLVTEATRDRNVIDLVFASYVGSVFDVKTIEPFLSSDHSAVEFSVPGSCKPSEPAKKFRDFRHADYDAINAFLCRIDWDTLLEDCANDVQERWDVFVSVLTAAIDTYVPLKPVSKAKRKDPKEIRKLLAKRKRFYHNKQREEYKECTKEYKIARKKQYEMREAKIVESGDINGLYKYAKSKLVSKPDIAPLRDMSGSLALSDVEKAKVLIDNFSLVYTIDNGNMPQFDSKVPENVYKSDVLFTEAVVHKALRKLPNKLSSTPDGFPAFFLKRVADSISAPLAELFSLSFVLGKLPRVWLTANVVPVYKKNDASDPLNYRPISLTCVCCKLMETIIRESVVSFLSDQKLISGHQHGFRARYSTSTQLLECQAEWVQYLIHSLGIDVIYLDFAKAFDSVCHTKLLLKLRAYGISGNLLAWFKAFLSERTQRVLINETFSDSVEVTSSVPQGSVLGPLLFLLYVDDIVELVTDLPVSIKLFADDVKLYSNDRNSADLQNALDRIANWADKWQLKLASPKCTVFSIGSGGGGRNVYRIGGVALENNTCCRDLGVLLSSSYKTSEQCAIVSSRAMRRSGMIFRAFSSRCANTLRKAYIVYVRPLLESATQTWCPYLLKDINAIERVQKFFTRVLFKRCGLQKTTYEKRLKTLDLETLEIRRIRSDLKMYYQILHGKSVIKIDSMFTFSVHKRTRGNSMKLVKPFCRTKYIESAFHIRRIKLWNSLPDSVVKSQSVNAFITRLSGCDLSTECTVLF